MYRDRRMVDDCMADVVKNRRRRRHRAGSASHSEYTVTGDTVNLAARLCAESKDGQPRSGCEPPPARRQYHILFVARHLVICRPRAGGGRAIACTKRSPFWGRRSISLGLTGRELFS